MARIKLIEIELSRSLVDFTDLGSYSTVHALVRLYGTTIAWVPLPVWNGCCSAQAQAQAIFPHYNQIVAQTLLRDRLLHPAKYTHQPGWTLQDWLPSDLTQEFAPTPLNPPKITILFCPQFAIANSPTLADASTPALQALQALEYPNLEIKILKADPSGWNAARNLAIHEATGAIIAFTDDRMVLSPDWATTLAATFTQNPEVSVVTGLAVPQQLENATQATFEHAYGLGRGFQRKYFTWMQPPTWVQLGTMNLGMAGNWAARRSHLLDLGGLDPRLDVPGQTAMGGNWDLWSRTLLAGRSLLYEPALLGRYLLPSDDKTAQHHLQQTIAGFYSYIRAGWKRSPQLRIQFLCLGLWKFVRLCMAMVRNYGVPRSWIAAELRGIWQGLKGYEAVKRQTPRSTSTPAIGSVLARPHHSPLYGKAINGKVVKARTAVRQINLQQPLSELTELAGYDAVRVYLNLEQHPVGWLELNLGNPNRDGSDRLSTGQLATAIADQLLREILALSHHYNGNAAWEAANLAITRHWTHLATHSLPTGYAPLPIDIPVTIIITTCDRPQDLYHCLKHLIVQKTERSLEIIVADNRPASGLSKAVVDQFPQVKYVAEPRPGGSYGRNAAFVASTGDIVVTVDDDVTVPPDWLEKLIAPMIRPEVMVVTGNVLPLELETPAQWMFETLRGGLGAGFAPFEVDRAWWDSFKEGTPPVWNLGVSANAAFRASIFHHPDIGMMDEILGPGTPTVGGEENHLIYKVLRAGYTVVYEPAAQVWHRHRREMQAFYKQVYGHMKGGTAYHLLLWLQERDPRAWKQLFIHMPRYLRDYTIDRLLGKHQMPWRIMWSEMSGYLAGFWGYWQSAQRLKKLGRSDRYIPVADRDPARQTSAKQTSARPTNPMQPIAPQPDNPPNPRSKTPSL
ncbi:MAG: glycosyltransferase [Synechococcales bacterium]|nr:glycosyltransferase [Synechococcales bacterium]